MEKYTAQGIYTCNHTGIFGSSNKFQYQKKSIKFFKDIFVH